MVNIILYLTKNDLAPAFNYLVHKAKVTAPSLTSPDANGRIGEKTELKNVIKRQLEDSSKIKD